MNLNTTFTKYISITISILLFGFSSQLSKLYEKPFNFVSKQDSSINLNDNFLKTYNLGLKRFISSTLWISTILESDINHYKKKDLNSWMFLRFNSISNLEPLFYENYLFGGTYLSIIKDDIQGASSLYEKGLTYYSNDFALLRDAGFHYYFEAEDYVNAYKTYSKLRTHPRATPLIISALARLESDKGNSDDAFHFLLSRYEQIPNKGTLIAIKLRQHLYAIKAEKDLKCLNENVNKTDCDHLDFFGDKYFSKNGLFQAVNAWEPFRIKKKRRIEIKNPD